MRVTTLLFALCLGGLLLATCQLPEFRGTPGAGESGAHSRAETTGPAGPVAGTPSPASATTPGPDGGPDGVRDEGQGERRGDERGNGPEEGPDEVPEPIPARTGPVVQLGHATPETFPGPVRKDAARGTVGYWGIRLKDVDKRSQAGHIQGRNLPAEEDLILIFSTSGDATIGTSAEPGVDIILFDHHVTSATVRGAGTDPIDVPENKFRITVPAGETGWAVHSEFPPSSSVKRGAKRFELELIRIVGKDSGAEYPVGWNAKGEFLIVDDAVKPKGR